MKYRVFLFRLGVLFAARTLHAATWHVSPEPLAKVATESQFRTINESARIVSPGDTVLIHSGVYRETVIIEKSGTRERPIRFEAAPVADVTITGLDRMVGWRKEAGTANVSSVEWPHRFIPWSKTDAHPGDDYHQLIGRAEQVLVNGYPLQQTLELDQMSRGSFYVDLATKRLYVSPSNDGEIKDGAPSSLRVEAATRSILWHCKGDYVIVRGIRFRYAANHAQAGAVIFEGRGDIAEDCIFERTNAVGAGFTGPDQIARRCTFQDNGQLGFAAHRAHNLILTGCLVRNNNTKGFNRGWEAGGNKLVLSRGVVLEKSSFIANRGFGIWFDIGNENCTVRNCLIADNEDAGIFYEISYGLHAHDNVIIGNGLVPNPAAWGAQAGIVLSSSPDCMITRNLLIANKEGFNFREQHRTTTRIDDSQGAPGTLIWNHNEIIRNNVLAYNRDVQTRGWFAIDDERHWPRSLQEKKAPPGLPGSQDPSAAGKLPENSSLESLQIKFQQNLYATQDDQALFIWGTSAARHATYSTIRAIQDALRLEQRSRLSPFHFRDYPTRDFRVPSNSPALRMKCYPRGEVPGVSLGIMTRQLQRKSTRRDSPQRN